MYQAGLEINEIQQVVSTAQRLGEHFKRSKLVTTALQRCQQQMSSQSDQHGNSIVWIVQDIKNSVYYMMNHLLKLWLPITAVLADGIVIRQDHYHLDLQPTSWDLLE